MGFKAIEFDETYRQQVLEKYYPFLPMPKLTDKMWCLACRKWFKVKNFKLIADFVWDSGEPYLSCGNRKCSGGTRHWLTEGYDD